MSTHLLPPHSVLGLAALFAWFAPVAAPAAETPRAQPNIVLITADDLGYGALGCYGGKEISTPHLDSLARDGIRCASGYVTAPICGPSRVGLLTGRYQQRFGYFLNPDVTAGKGRGSTFPGAHPLLPQALKNAGYATGHVGKWNVTDDPRPYFDEAHAVMDWKGAYFPEADGRYLGVDGPGFRATRAGWGPPSPGGEYLTDKLTRHAVDFIDRHARKPFFLYLGYNAPHTPLEAERRFEAALAGIADPDRKLYAAMVAALDENIGRLLAKLDQAGLRENTLVIFVSDNGPETRGEGTLGSPGPLRGHKYVLHEGGIRVPFLFRWPARLRGGQIASHPVSTLDLFPTLQAAAGAPPPPGPSPFDGTNLLPYLADTATPPPARQLFWSTGRSDRADAGGTSDARNLPMSAIREGDWKLVESQGAAQLFNLRDDLGERRDVAAAQPETAARLRAALGKWSAALPAPVSQAPRPTTPKKKAR